MEQLFVWDIFFHKEEIWVDCIETVTNKTCRLVLTWKPLVLVSFEDQNVFEEVKTKMKNPKLLMKHEPCQLNEASSMEPIPDLYKVYFHSLEGKKSFHWTASSFELEKKCIFWHYPKTEEESFSFETKCVPYCILEIEEKDLVLEESNSKRCSCSGPTFRFRDDIWKAQVLENSPLSDLDLFIPKIESCYLSIAWYTATELLTSYQCIHSVMISFQSEQKIRNYTISCHDVEETFQTDTTFKWVGSSEKDLLLKIKNLFERLNQKNPVLPVCWLGKEWESLFARFRYHNIPLNKTWLLCCISKKKTNSSLSTRNLLQVFEKKNTVPINVVKALGDETDLVCVDRECMDNQDFLRLEHDTSISKAISLLQVQCKLMRKVMKMYPWETLFFLGSCCSREIRPLVASGQVYRGVFRVLKSFYDENKILSPLVDKKVTPQGGYIWKKSDDGFFVSNVETLDVSGMYPTILTENNLCHSTHEYTEYIDGEREKWKRGKKESVISLMGEKPGDLQVHHWNRSKEGVLPRLMKKFQKIRQDLKQRKQKQEEICVKLVMNAIIGNLNMPHSMIYHPALFACITGYGRIFMKKLQETIRSKGVEITHIVTDSLSLNTTNLSKEKVESVIEFCHEMSKKWGLEFKRETWKNLAFSSKNNRYAYLDENNKLVLKGFESNSNSPFYNRAFREIIRLILEGKEEEARKYFEWEVNLLMYLSPFSNLVHRNLIKSTSARSILSDILHTSILEAPDYYRNWEMANLMNDPQGYMVLSVKVPSLNEKYIHWRDATELDMDETLQEQKKQLTLDLNEYISSFQKEWKPFVGWEEEEEEEKKKKRRKIS